MMRVAHLPIVERRAVLVRRREQVVEHVPHAIRIGHAEVDGPSVAEGPSRVAQLLEVVDALAARLRSRSDRTAGQSKAIGAAMIAMTTPIEY